VPRDDGEGIQNHGLCRPDPELSSGSQADRIPAETITGLRKETNADIRRRSSQVVIRFTDPASSIRASVTLRLAAFLAV
jgi:hypothetical protein